MKVLYTLLIFLIPFFGFAQSDYSYTKYLVEQQIIEKDNNGYINSNNLMLSSPISKAIEDEIKSFAIALETQLNAMENEYQQLVNEYEINAHKYSKLVKEDKINIIESIEIRIVEFKKNAVEALGQKEVELLEPFISMIKSSIEQVGKDRNYTYIFDTSRDSLEVIFENINAKRDINNSDWKGNGTGFIISKSGYIATNNHVIDGASELAIEFKYNNEIKEFKVSVVKIDKINDLAIIKINDSEFYNLDLIPYNFKTETVDVGTEVFALGYPLALSLMGKDIKFTDGKISSKTGPKGDITKYQIQVPIQPGNSGGPLFDKNGNLIGITSSGIDRGLDLTENVNYAIKTNYLLNLVDVLPEEIILPSNTYLSSKKLTEQIKILSDYVVLIKRK